MAIKANAQYTIIDVMDGEGISSITNYYLATNSSSGVTRETSGWTTTIQTVTTSKKYLWNYEVVMGDKGSTISTSDPIIIGVYGETGSAGTGIESVVEEYALSTSKTTAPADSEFSTTAPTWTSGKYLWTRTKITYKNPTSTSYTTKICDNSWEAVNEIQIGGTNLLLKTNQGKTNWGFNIGNKFKSPTLENITWLGQNGLKVTTNGLNESYTSTWRLIYYNDNNIYKILEPNESYVLTFDSTNKHTGFGIQEGNGSNNIVDSYIFDYKELTDINGEPYYHLIFNFKTKTDFNRTAQYIYIASGMDYMLEEGNVVKYANIKIEKGNKSTNWTAAPEDTISNYQAYADAINTNLQTQIDGKVETWFYSGVPTASNAPANTWTDDATKLKHVGDYYYDNSTGDAYQYTSSYTWSKVSSAVATALGAAQDAQTTANNKKRVFTSTPSGDVDKGDLWTDGSDLKVYNGTAWVLATDYTNFKIEDIEVGGRNLVLKSDQEKTSKNTITTYDLSSFGKTYLPGHTYTISFDIKCSSDDKKADCYLRSSDNSVLGSAFSIKNISTTYKHYIFKYDGVLSSSINNLEWFALRTSSGGGADTTATYTIKNIKVESGNIATNWTPAPEDFESDLDALALKQSQDIEDLQNQIDGVIMDYFLPGIPLPNKETPASGATTNNNPYDEWMEGKTTAEEQLVEKKKHIGDLYYDTDTNYCYRWMQDPDNTNNFYWALVKDSAVTEAMQKAQDAYDLADGKRRVFYTQPTPPYDLGDLWVQGSNGDILRCQTEKASGASYAAADWVKASKYTDDTTVNNLQIGGRNLAEGTEDTWKSIALTDKQNQTIYPMSITDLTTKGLKPGDTLRISFRIKFSNDITATGTGTKASHIQGNRNNGGSWQDVGLNGGNQQSAIENIIASDSKEGIVQTYMKLPNNFGNGTYTEKTQIGFRFDYYTGTFYVKDEMITKGDKYLDWTPAPEDIDNKISTKISEVDVEYYLSTSNTTLAGGSWQTTAPTWVDGKYMWSRTKITTDAGTSYSPSENGTCIAGATGKSGSSITIKSTGVTYQSSTSGTTTPTGTWSTTVPAVASGSYLWTKTVVTYSDDTTTTSYSVAYKGTNGTNSYTYVRYSANSDGTDFVTTPTSATAYIGVYTGTSSTAPTNKTSYTWSKYQGSAGNGIRSITYYYATTTTQTTPEASSVTSTTIPTLSKTNKYLWQKEVIDFTDSSVDDQTTVSLIAVYGDDGSTGPTGTGVESITEEFYLSTSKTTQSDGSWVTTMPTWSNGKYIWTRSKIVYKNPTSTAYTTPLCSSEWEAVNEIKVGAVNKLRGSLKVSGNDNFYWMNNGADPELATLDGETVLHASITTASTNIPSIRLKKSISLEWGKTYIYSADIMTDAIQDYYLAHTPLHYQAGCSVEKNGISMVQQSGITVTRLSPTSTPNTPANKWQHYVYKIVCAETTPDETRPYAVFRPYIWGKCCSTASITEMWARNVLIVEGNMDTSWAQAPEDLETEVANLSSNVSETIVGTQTTATRFWKGTTSLSELKDGQQITYWLPYSTAYTDAGDKTVGVDMRVRNSNGSTTVKTKGTTIISFETGTSTNVVWLNLTLSNNTTTGWIPCYYSGYSRITGHYPAGNQIRMTYKVNASVGGVAYTGWFADANYDSGNTYDRIRFNQYITAASSGITAGKLIVGEDLTYKNIAASTATTPFTFDVTKPILYADSTKTSGQTSNANYLSYPSVNLRNTIANITLADKETCYLVGVLEGNKFTVAREYSDSGIYFLTTTQPTADDGYYYISLGYMYSTYQMILYPEHPIYKFVNGTFKNLNQVAYEAQDDATKAQDDIDNYVIGARNYVIKSQAERNVAIASETVRYSLSSDLSSRQSDRAYLSLYAKKRNITGSEDVGLTAKIYYVNDAKQSVSKLIDNFGITALTTEYNRYIAEISLTGINGATYIEFIGNSTTPANNQFYIQKVQLEVGNLATDWHLSQEDLEKVEETTITKIAFSKYYDYNDFLTRDENTGAILPNKNIKWYVSYGEIEGEIEGLYRWSKTVTSYSDGRDDTESLPILGSTIPKEFKSSTTLYVITNKGRSDIDVKNDSTLVWLELKPNWSPEYENKKELWYRIKNEYSYGAPEYGNPYKDEEWYLTYYMNDALDKLQKNFDSINNGTKVNYKEDGIFIWGRNADGTVNKDKEISIDSAGISFKINGQMEVGWDISGNFVTTHINSEDIAAGLAQQGEIKLGGSKFNKEGNISIYDVSQNPDSSSPNIELDARGLHIKTKKGSIDIDRDEGIKYIVTEGSTENTILETNENDKKVLVTNITSKGYVDVGSTVKMVALQTGENKGIAFIATS